MQQQHKQNTQVMDRKTIIYGNKLADIMDYFAPGIMLICYFDFLTMSVYPSIYSLINNGGTRLVHLKYNFYRNILSTLFSFFLYY